MRQRGFPILIKDIVEEENETAIFLEKEPNSGTNWECFTFN